MTDEEHLEKVKRWQYNKDHVFLFPHDDKTLIGYLRQCFGNIKGFLLILSIIFIISLVCGVVFGLIIGDIEFSIIGWLIFYIASAVVVFIFGFFCYINYLTKDDHAVYGGAAWVVISVIIYWVLEYRIKLLPTTHSIIATVVIAIVALYLLLKAMKNTFYEEENPLSVYLNEQ